MLASSGIKCFPLLAKNVCGYLFPKWNYHFRGLSLSIGYIGPPWKPSAKNPLLSDVSGINFLRTTGPQLMQKNYKTGWRISKVLPC